MLSRTRRTRVVAVVVIAALAGGTLLGALATFAGGSTVEVPQDGPWTVIAGGDLTSTDCADDPAVQQSYLSSTDPASGGGLMLTTDATPADVERVVACLAESIDPGRITVVPTSALLQDQGA